MNILFVVKSLKIGGVEVVTQFLANKFVKEGHNVSVFSFLDESPSVIEKFDDRVYIYVANNYKVDKENIKKLYDILVSNKVNIIINQWGLPLTPIRLLKKSSLGLNVKIVSVFHNAPNFNGHIQSVTNEINRSNNLFLRSFLKIKRYLIIKVSSYSLRCNYNLSDRFLVLSNSYLDVFSKFAKVKDLSRLGVMTNPITIDNDGYSYNAQSKQKEILFVGRLDAIQKKVSRIIHTWALLESKFPDWKITIVGDGPEKNNLINLVSRYKLHRVSFEGYKDPKPFYKRSCILVMTSDFEGFPLVLAESMCYGVVPVIYESFLSLRDIVTNMDNGIIVNGVNGKFNKYMMSDALSKLMSNNQLLDVMARNAIEKSSDYSISKIYNQWLLLFNKLI